MKFDSTLANKRICSQCVRDSYLDSYIPEHGKMVNCYYCDEEGPTIELAELALLVEQAFEDHYEKTPEDPDDWEYMRIQHFNEDWERHGESVEDILTYELDIEQEPVQELIQLLKQKNYDHEDAAMGYENEFSDSALYERKNVENDYYHQAWENFEQQIKTESRFFNAEAEQHLGLIFGNIDKYLTFRGKNVLEYAGPKQRLKKLYRARVFQSEDKLNEAIARPDLFLGSPPNNMATAGRMNARGISVFYGATHSKLVLAEVRPPVGSWTAVATFKIIRKLTLLNLTSLKLIQAKGSILDPNYINELEKVEFLKRLTNLISRPIMPNDVDSEYLVTQAIADYLSSRTKIGFDGLIFSSSQTDANHQNVVLFHKSSLVAALQYPEGTEIFRAAYDPEENEKNYDVIEMVPEKVLEEVKTEQFTDKLANLMKSLKDPEKRDITLEVNLNDISVHEIKKISVTTKKYSVKRYKKPFPKKSTDHDILDF